MPNKRKVTVRLTQQQIEALKQVIQKGTFGKTYEELLLNLFREWVNENYGEGGVL